jgi:hypothetical protein
MVSIGLFSSISVVVFGLNWLVDVAGALVALFLLVRHRNAASVLALIGFGLPALIGPFYIVLQWALVDRLGVPALVTLTAVNGLLSFVAAICLVVAFWLALRGTASDKGDRPGA